MSLEQIFERTECWCSTNVRRQTVPHRRTGDAECSIPETSSGTRDDQVSTSCTAVSNGTLHNNYTTHTSTTPAPSWGCTLDQSVMQASALACKGSVCHPIGERKKSCLITTLANVDRFSKFFQQLIYKKIICVYMTKIFTSPAVCCHSTWWNSKIQKCQWFSRSRVHCATTLCDINILQYNNTDGVC